MERLGNWKPVYIGLSPRPRMQSSPPGWHDIFRIGDPEVNLNLPQLLGGGTTQRIYKFTVFFMRDYFFQGMPITGATKKWGSKWVNRNLRKSAPGHLRVCLANIRWPYKSDSSQLKEFTKLPWIFCHFRWPFSETWQEKNMGQPNGKTTFPGILCPQSLSKREGNL